MEESTRSSTAIFSVPVVTCTPGPEAFFHGALGGTDFASTESILSDHTSVSQTLFDRLTLESVFGFAEVCAAAHSRSGPEASSKDLSISCPGLFLWTSPTRGWNYFFKSAKSIFFIS